MKEIKCEKCGLALGVIEKARILKGVTFVCGPCSADPEALRKAAAAFGANKRNGLDLGDLKSTFESIFGKGFGK